MLLFTAIFPFVRTNESILSKTRKNDALALQFAAQLEPSDKQTLHAIRDDVDAAQKLTTGHSSAPAPWSHRQLRDHERMVRASPAAAVRVRL